MHPPEQREDLIVQIVLGQPNSRMVAAVIPGTTVIDVMFDALLGLLLLGFAADSMLAMAAGNHSTGIHHFVRTIDLLAQEHLHSVPSLSIDQRFMLSRMPFPMVLYLADVGPVGQKGVQLAWAESGSGLRVGHALFGKPGRQGVDWQAVESIKMKIRCTLGPCSG